jgi:hypothetical protein
MYPSTFDLCSIFSFQFFKKFLKISTVSFEGIEGTVDIATICGTTGPIINNLVGRHRLLAPFPTSEIKIGFIVQTISVNANMPLPVAP